MKSFFKAFLTCALFFCALTLRAEGLELVRVYNPQAPEQTIRFRATPSAENTENVLCALPHDFIFIFLNEQTDPSGKQWIHGIANTQDGKYEGWMMAEFTQRLPVTSDLLNDCDEEGRTFLMGAIREGVDSEIIVALLNEGADVNARTNKGQTALMLAAFHNADLKTIAALLKNKADPNARDDEGYTALTYASNPEIIPLLVKSGAGIKARDNSGRTVLMTNVMLHARNSKFNPQTLAALIKNGADPNAKDENDKTVLMWAAMRSSPEVIDILIKNGAKIDLKDDIGMNALTWGAFGNTNPDVLTVLIRKGLDINTENDAKLTPLIFAAMKNPNPEIISFLLKNGANAKVKDVSGKKAIDYAKENKALKNTKAYWELHDASF